MEEQFIPGIFNYCDRWCERCSFKNRCRVYASEQRLTEAQRDPNNPAFWAFVQENFRKVLSLVETMAEKEGIDIKTLRASGEIPPVQELPPERKALEALGHDYALRTLEWLKYKRPALLEEDVRYQYQLGLDIRPFRNQLNDALDAIQWYCTMIASKIQRALSGFDEQDEWYVEDPLQSDANGTAKVALICIERSLGAWEITRTCLPDFSDEIIDFFVLLEKIRRGLMSYFPHADQFIRPGFDEREGG